ncbi:MAG: lysylphosphatidylglycerol synthase transmembrane domain-containing protein [Anaerolineales bacterium]|jgi:uncharacterized protein (TIRG00374 family)
MEFQTNKEGSSRLRNYLTIILSTLIIVIFAIYVWQNWDRFAELFDLSVTSISLLAGLTIFPIIGSGLINYALYRELGAEVSMGESFGLSAVNSFVNMLPLSAGMIAKAMYLKRQHRLPYERFLAATLALYIVFLFTSGLTGIAVLLYMDWATSNSSPSILYAAFLAMSASILTFAVPSYAKSETGSLKKRIAEAITGWEILKKRPSLILWFIFIQLIMSLLFAWRLWIAFRTLSQDVTLAHCLLFSSATTLTQLVTIMPAGLGIREGIVAGVSSLQGFDAAASTLAVGLDRIVSSAVILVMGALSLGYMGKRIGSRPTQVDSNDDYQES